MLLKMRSYLYLLYLWLLEVTHICSCCLVHERCVISIRLWKSYLIRDVWIDSLVSCGLCCEGRIVLLHHLLLHPDPSFFIISFLVSYHLQVFNLCFRSGRQTFFHPFSCPLKWALHFFSFILILDDIGLTHW